MLSPRIDQYSPPSLARMENRRQLLLDEGLIICHAGEIPEIAYYNSLHYLSSDPEGPGLTPSAAECAYLREQVVARYREIILRDLTPANRDLPLFRGIRRVIWNWQRLEKFLHRHALLLEQELQQEVVAALGAFLDNELREVEADVRVSCLNCRAEELAAFLRRVGLEQDEACSRWLQLCPATECAR